MAEGVGFEPTDLSVNGFQDRRLKPLGHPSRNGFLFSRILYHNSPGSNQRWIHEIFALFFQESSKFRVKTPSTWEINEMKKIIFCLLMIGLFAGCATTDESGGSSVSADKSGDCKQKAMTESGGNNYKYRQAFNDCMAK